MGRTLLIDGDILMYRFAFSNEFNIQWDENTSSKVVQHTDARADIDDFIVNMAEKAQADKIRVALSSPTNFRKKVYPEYKSNRKDAPKPEMLKFLRDHLIANYHTLAEDELEGDDIMGITATTFPDDYVIASIDKDLKQIPGIHYNWNTAEFDEVSYEQADFNFYMQALMGDPTDGYPGCPKIGPVKAEKILRNSTDPWKAILETYAEKGLDENYALTMARVARILRKDDYNLDTKEVILWTPATKSFSEKSSRRTARRSKSSKKSAR